VPEELGYAGAAELQLSAAGQERRHEFRVFLDKYFSSFMKTSQGMQRLDPQVL